MKPKAWSYSALSAFETCPRQYYETKVSREVVEQASEALTWGTTAHEAMEKRVKAGTPLPPALESHEPLIKKLTSRPGQIEVERRLAFNRQMKSVDFFAPDVWVRGVFDFALRQKNQALIVDWKTGKRRMPNDQLKLFALFGLYEFPLLDRIDTAFYWLNMKKLDIESFFQEDKTKLWEVFLPRVERFEAAFHHENFPARPSGLCKRWCPCLTCPHNGGYGR